MVYYNVFSPRLQIILPIEIDEEDSVIRLISLFCRGSRPPLFEEHVGPLDGHLIGLDRENFPQVVSAYLEQHKDALIHNIRFAATAPDYAPPTNDIASYDKFIHFIVLFDQEPLLVRVNYTNKKAAYLNAILSLAPLLQCSRGTLNVSESRTKVMLLSSTGSIYEPIFAVIKHRLSHLDQVSTSPQLRKQVAVLVKRASELYTGERRQEATRPILEELFGCTPLLHTNCITDSTYGPDTQDRADLQRFGILLYRISYRDEFGLEGNPIEEVKRAYALHVSHRAYAPLRNVSRCPSVLVAIASPYIYFFSAFLLEVIVVEPLTDPILLGCTASEERFLHVSRVFTVIRDALENLVEMYNALKLDPLVADSGRTLSPVLADEHEHGEALSNLRITSRLLNGVERDRVQRWCDMDNFQGTLRCPIFRGKYNGRDVVVKFCERYGREAHECLAKQSPPLAPKFHFQAALLGGYVMVVMDYVDASTAFDMYKYRPMSMSLAADVQRAMQVLHSRGSVHGDLRRSNVLVQEKRRNRKRAESEEGLDASAELENSGNEIQDHAMLIDFDWSGTAGETTYPFTINLDIRWAPTVFAAGPILKEHDEYMLNRFMASSVYHDIVPFT
ncbi:hypothetical protein EUX98_g6864 [Antrodiella citrinella]|uniref:Protein kinase domain-containing protein n=1 Tax=Antrodiella citrinella TaxID=2447956 RepID=A0A4S4MNS1_9APHY|nr:hypothetical protein EUX98_g6864 [Antrodiella citrinella]